MFDPIISLNTHIALLKMLEDAKQEVEKAKGKGIILLAAKGLGRAIMAELEKSRKTMQANKMWVYDTPIGERRYRYTLFGKREEHEIPQTELDNQVRTLINEIAFKSFGEYSGENI